MADAALQGVKVIDFTHYIAGPFCTKLLADYGAEVIKIERPNGGDPARGMGPFYHDEPGMEKSGLFLHLNTNKKSITLNLKTELGHRIAKELVEEADLVVESFPPGVMDRLGLGYEALEQISPEVVMVSISNFGQWGPYRDHKLTDIVAFAMGGVMSITGFAGREPIKMALTARQMVAGNMAATGAVAALLGQRLQGIGQHVDFSIFEFEAGTPDRGSHNLVTVAYSGIPFWKRNPAGQGVLPTILPAGVFQCQDGYVEFSAQRWEPFCLMMDHPELIVDPRFAAPEAIYNLEYKEEVHQIFLEWLKPLTKGETMEKAQAAGIFAAALNTMEDLFQDRHFRERGFFVAVDHPVVGELEYPGAPFKMSESPWQAGRAPLLGEHNQEIYCGRLGYSNADLVLMRQLGII